MVNAYQPPAKQQKNMPCSVYFVRHKRDGSRFEFFLKAKDVLPLTGYMSLEASDVIIGKVF